MEKQKEQTGLQKLKAHVKEKSFDRLYIFYGAERFLLEHYLQQVKKHLLDELTESFNYHRFTSETFDLQGFADAVENLPMMAEHTLVQVDDIDIYKLGDAERNKMAEILSDIPEYCTVIFVYETVAWKPDGRLKKLHSAVVENATQVEFPIQQQRDLVPWITRHFAARQKKISNDLCFYLIEITGGAMTTLAGEIDKICAYSGAQEIKKSDIDAVTEPVLDAVVYNLTDQLGRGQFPMAFETLQKLLKMQQEPISILGAIGSQLRKIGTARTLLDNAGQAGELAKLYTIPDFVARKTMESARSFSQSFCKKALELVLETDRNMKTSFDDPERLLELLVIQLSAEARRD